MKLNDLQPGLGAHKSKKRIGRGVGSGHGVTATRGSKGQKAREGFKMIPGFEGGQIRMIKRLPHKRGFVNNWRITFDTINVGLLGRRFEAGATVDAGTLSTRNLPVKVLGDGEIKVALNVTAHRFSGSAREKIEAAGGTANELGVKKPHGKPAKVTAKDVTITHGEPNRQVAGMAPKGASNGRRRREAGTGADASQSGAPEA
jgi:large subunit ribosomal protein L15